MAKRTAEQRNPAPALAPWEFAGLLVTYWCNARCAFCYVHSGPDRHGHMSIERAVELWRSLDDAAARQGHTMRVHIGGGEPFGDWPRLAGILRAARNARLTRPEKVETNAFWATDDHIVRARLELLDALGVGKLIVSTDVYHQEFILIERVERCVRVAREVLGRGRVIARWWDFLQNPADLRRMSASEKEDAYRAALDHHPDRLTGRAALRLAPLLPRKPADTFKGDDCVEAVLGCRHVHVDAYGNVFPGVCGGIILGRADGRSIRDVWEDLAENWQGHPVISAVVAGGSYELMQRAKAFEYEELPEGYADKCHLCTHVRQFLLERGVCPEAVGPPECYANERDMTEARKSR